MNVAQASGCFCTTMSRNRMFMHVARTQSHLARVSGDDSSVMFENMQRVACSQGLTGFLRVAASVICLAIQPASKAVVLSSQLSGQ